MFVGRVRSLPIEWSNIVLRNYLQLLNLTEKSYRSQHSSLFWYCVSDKKVLLESTKKIGFSFRVPPFREREATV